MTDLSTPDAERRGRVLDAALVVFARYGFRKTSMDDVARAGDISRQGLYFLFGGKEELFREALAKMMRDGLAAVEAALSGDGPLDERLIAAMAVWFGRTAGSKGETADELFIRSLDLVGDRMRDYGAAVLKRVTEAIATSAFGATLAERGLTADDVALTLQYLGEGLKHDALPRDEFRKRLGAGVRLIVS